MILVKCYNGFTVKNNMEPTKITVCMAHLYITKQMKIWKTAHKLYESNEIHSCWYADILSQKQKKWDLQAYSHVSFTPHTFSLTRSGVWNTFFRQNSWSKPILIIFYIMWRWNSSPSQISHRSQTCWIACMITVTAELCRWVCLREKHDKEDMVLLYMWEQDGDGCKCSVLFICAVAKPLRQLGDIL